jgi:hypothetical protein
MATPIQRSWESREFNEQIKLGVLELTHFLNSFGTPLFIPAADDWCDVRMRCRQLGEVSTCRDQWKTIQP